MENNVSKPLPRHPEASVGDDANNKKQSNLPSHDVAFLHFGWEQDATSGRRSRWEMSSRCLARQRRYDGKSEKVAGCPTECARHRQPFTSPQRLPGFARPAALRRLGPCNFQCRTGLLSGCRFSAFSLRSMMLMIGLAASTARSRFSRPVQKVRWEPRCRELVLHQRRSRLWRFSNT